MLTTLSAELLASFIASIASFSESIPSNHQFNKPLLYFLCCSEGAGDLVKSTIQLEIQTWRHEDVIKPWKMTRWYNPLVMEDSVGPVTANDTGGNMSYQLSNVKAHASYDNIVFTPFSKEVMFCFRLYIVFNPYNVCDSSLYYITRQAVSFKYIRLMKTLKPCICREQENEQWNNIVYRNIVLDRLVFQWLPGWTAKLGIAGSISRLTYICSKWIRQSV